MKIGLSTLLSAKGTPEEIVRLAEKLKLDCVEVVLDAPHFFPDFEMKKLKSLYEVTRSCDLQTQIHDSFLDLNPISQYSELRKITIERSKESIRCCDFLNGDLVTVHPGRCWLRKNQDIFRKCKNWFEDYLKEVLDYARAREISIAIETGAHPADYPSEPERILRYVKDREGIGITLDIGHIHLRERDDDEPSGVKIANLIRSFGKELMNVHLHDNDGRSDDHLPPGRGDIDFDPILEALEDEYHGPIILELWDPSAPEEAAEEGIEYLKSFSS